jgi:hypothetical protein
MLPGYALLLQHGMVGYAVGCPVFSNLCPHPMSMQQQHTAPQHGQPSAQNKKTFFGSGSRGSFFPPSVQTKLSVNAPNDAYEQEADAVADKVVQLSRSEQAAVKPAPAIIQQKCADCEKEEELQRKEEGREEEKIHLQTMGGGEGGDAPADVETGISSSKGSGSAMPAPLREQMESGIGADFSDVKIHTGDNAVQMNQQLNARAFTHGSDIYFNNNQYSPASADGQHLLAHELTHVVQQGGGAQRMIQKAPPQQEQNTKEEYGEDYVIYENELKNFLAGGLYPGILARGYIKIEILNLPPEKAALFVPENLKPQPKVDIRNEEERMSDGPLFNDSGEMQIIEGTAPLDPAPAKPAGPKKGIVLRVTRHINIKTKRGVEFGLNMIADTALTKNFEVTKDTPKAIIKQLFNYPFGKANIMILFNGQYPGDPFPLDADPIHDEDVTSLNDIIRRHAPELVDLNFEAQPQYDAAIRMMLANAPHAAIPLYDPNRKIKGKEFKTLDDAAKAAGKMGKKDMLIVQSPDGKFHLYELTPMELFNIAEELRRNEGEQKEVDWRTLGTKVKAEKVFINGKEMALSDYVHNMNYVDPQAAAEGRGKVKEEEVIVYRMRSSGFYARMPVTHDNAMALWQVIDDKIELPENIAKAKDIAEGTFVSLHVKGTARFHTIDADYVEGKRYYYQNIEEYNKDVKVVDPAGQEYHPLMYDIIKKASGEELQQFIEAQLDRGFAHDLDFRDSAKDKKQLQRGLELIVFNRLNNQANRIAIDIITKTRAALKTFTDSDDALRMLILSMSSMDTAARHDVLTMMGVEEEKKAVFSAILSDPKSAAEIAYGIPVKTLSFKTLRSAMQTVYTDTGAALQQIENGTFKPLLADGDFCSAIRDEVYKRNGFTKLKAVDYPHRDQTSGLFPDPLAGNSYDYSGMTEQIFANGVAHSANATLVMKIGVISGLALLTAAIVVFSGGVGAGVAAAFFEVGSAGFIATEIVVTAATMTVLSEGLAQAMGQGALGKDKAYYGFDELGKDFLKNLALAGVFAGVGRIMKNVSAVYRISAVGTLFLGISLGEYYHKNKKLPQGEDLYLFIYENLITLAAIEAGAVLARPLTKMFYTIGVDARVTRLNARITEIKLGIGASQQKLATMVAAKKFESGEALKLIGEQRVHLERMQKVLQEIRDVKDMKTEIDVEFELAKIDEALQKIRVAEFQQKIEFKQNRFAEDKVAYKPGPDAVKDITEFYGKDNVTGPDKEGMIEVKQADGSKLTFYPESKESEITAAALNKPAAKLDPAIPYSRNVPWSNFADIPGFKIQSPSSPESTAADFWKETGTEMYDTITDGRFYVKYDARTGRLLIGDVQAGRIIGFYIDDARVHPTKSASGVIVKDPLTDLPNIIGKLKTYHGKNAANTPLAGTYTSGASIVATPGKTTTIIGAFKVVDGRITYTDMPQLFDNFGNLKNADFGAKPGGFNVLNVGEGMYEPGNFFDKYNRPWLEEAIKRGDIFYAASDPTRDIFIFERDKAGNWVEKTDPVTGIKERKRTGYGKEVQILEQNGYKYDPTTKTFKK